MDIQFQVTGFRLKFIPMKIGAGMTQKNPTPFVTLAPYQVRGKLQPESSKESLAETPYVYSIMDPLIRLDPGQREEEGDGD